MEMGIKIVPGGKNTRLAHSTETDPLITCNRIMIGPGRGIYERLRYTQARMR